jgi:hypothetical protein
VVAALFDDPHIDKIDRLAGPRSRACIQTLPLSDALAKEG